MKQNSYMLDILPFIQPKVKSIEAVYAVTITAQTYIWVKSMIIKSLINQSSNLFASDHTDPYHNKRKEYNKIIIIINNNKLLIKST